MHTLFQEGGPLLIAIILCGLGAIAVFLERLISLHKSRIRYSDFLSGIFNILEKGKIREAVSLCDETPGPIPVLMHYAITHRNETRADLRIVLDNAGRAEIARMERRLTVLSTIIRITPLLGLLGGLLGIFRSVLAIRAQAPFVQTVDLTSGLILALITAVAGLVVMIPAFVMYNILVVRIDRIVLDMEQASADILAFMARMPLLPNDDSTDPEIASLANPNSSSSSQEAFHEK